jgi:K(+)-stimulated pyrophosphate-energized sodium pump
MGIFQNNAGGAWDNAKKSFEKGVSINGEMFYKKSEPHKASVTGDTVGDPFKDTSGPSMNILIKLMSIVSLVIAPSLAQIYTTGADHNIGGTPEVIENTTTDELAKVPAEELGSDQYSTFLTALQEDGFFTDTTRKISIVGDRLVIDGKTLEPELSGKYIPLLNGVTNIMLEFE